MKIPLLTRGVFALSLAVLLVVPLARVEAGGKSKPKLPPKPQYNAISALDAAAHTITYVQMNGQMKESKTLKINERTEIEVNGEKATFDDLKVGMQVNVDIGMDADVAAHLSAKPAPPDPTPFPTPFRPAH